jgi:hypothetical protein
LSQEKNGEFIPFIIDRYQDGIDLASTAIWVNYTRPTENSVHQEPVVNVDCSKQQLRFGWLVSDFASAFDGILKFALEFSGSIIDENEESLSFTRRTSQASLTIQKTLANGTEVILSPDWQD